MQSKAKFFASLSLSISLSLLFFFSLSPSMSSAAILPENSCVANSCGTSEGTKQEAVYRTVCDKGCPTVHFEWERTEYADCPDGYFPGNGGNADKCYRWTNNGWRSIDRPTEVKEYSADVVYDKSHDPNKCHRPSDHILTVVYGMDHQAREDFKYANHEWKNAIDVNCREVFVRFDTVACNDAPVIQCEEQCPTECGYEGGEVANGQGGYKNCPATNSCSTHRWCFPTDSEETPTGYIAEAISIDVTPEYGKPWEPGKMIDRYCSYEAAGTCPTQCGYEGGDEVADGKGGTIICQATLACSTGEPEEEGDVLGESTVREVGEVKGTTTVVLASTAGEDRSMIYLIESMLLIATGASLIYVGSGYLKKY